MGYNGGSKKHGFKRASHSFKAPDPCFQKVFSDRVWGWSVLENYFPILLFILVGLAVGVGPLLLGLLVAPHKPDAAKNSPYECGFEAFEDARMRFDVRYYLVAILFILFDLEIAFLFPWAVVLQEIGLFGFVAMLMFLAVLVIGFIYEWKKGALEWD